MDVDECADYDHSCDVGQRCENTVGSFHCVGECELGLRMDPVSFIGHREIVVNTRMYKLYVEELNLMN